MCSLLPASVNQNGGVFHLRTAEEKPERGSIKKVLNHNREFDPDAHLYCVVVERHVNTSVVLTGSTADAHDQLIGIIIGR